MDAETIRGDAVHKTPSARDVLLSGLLVSLITTGVLVRLRFSSLESPLAELAGALAGAIFIPVAAAQLASRQLWPMPRRVPPLVAHAVLVPWFAALAVAAGLLVGSSWALARVRNAGLQAGGCASLEQLIAARWSPVAGEEAAFVAALPDGSSVLFKIEAGRPTCTTALPSQRR